MRPPFSVFLSSLALALRIQDADLTKEPQRDDQPELKLCSSKLGLLLVLANAFFPLSLVAALVWFPAPSPS